MVQLFSVKTAEYVMLERGFWFIEHSILKTIQRILREKRCKIEPETENDDPTIL